MTNEAIPEPGPARDRLVAEVDNRPFAGADWLRRQGVVLSLLGEDVANILGQTYRGIYHLPLSALTHTRTEWGNDHAVVLVVGGELATHDGDELMRLVLLSLEAGVRLAIRAKAPRYLELVFTRGAMMWCGRLPTIEQAVERWRAKYALAHLRAGPEEKADSAPTLPSAATAALLATREDT